MNNLLELESSLFWGSSPDIIAAMEKSVARPLAGMGATTTAVPELSPNILASSNISQRKLTLKKCLFVVIVHTKVREKVKILSSKVVCDRCSFHSI